MASTSAHPAHAAARRPNRLAGETSPYLLQHAHNPVDWYPWGPEAFDRARREDKPIFLSVGYSTCYWCHVMERQSFEDDAVAGVMNELFVNVKVDREERPDVDQLYMTGVQVQTRHGGWPMSVFLTPGREYFYGGTYFPPDDRYGRPGFVSLLRAIDEAWRNRRGEVLESAAQFTQILRQLAEPTRPNGTVEIDAAAALRMVEGSTDDYDPLNGGFGDAPKFPRETLLELLLRSLSAPALQSQMATRKSQVARRLHHALDAMAHGGIRDQLGGGFHRYSTDARWLVPHFEIMLYDNAMLGQLYAEASRSLPEPRFVEVARGVFDYVLREMTSPDGAFYTAFDAEVDAREGEPYFWTRQQVDDALAPEEARLFNRVYGLDAGPNFADPHGADPAPHANVLFVADRAALEQNAAALAAIRSRLLVVRAARKQPGLDTKVITSWNALMVRALAVGGAAVGEPRYVAAAGRAAEWLLRHHRTPDGGLWRASRDGAAKYEGFLDDYAFFAEALLDLHAVTGEPRWRSAAEEIAEQMMRRFYDESGGGFYFSDAAAQDLVIRQKTAADSPLPAGYAVAADVMRRLGRADIARRAVEAFAAPLAEHGHGMSRLLQVAIELLTEGPIRVSGAGGQGGLGRDDVRRAAESVVHVTVDPPMGRELVVRLRIAEGWHVQANPAGEGFIPTRVILPAAWVEAGAAVRYPAADAGEPPMYHGQVEIRVTLPEGADGGGETVGLEYQPCDETACLPAVMRRFKIPSRPTGSG